MCNSTIRAARHGAGLGGAVAQINGRPVLQPACNRVVTLEAAARPAKKPIVPRALQSSAAGDIRMISDGSATHHADASDTSAVVAAVVAAAGAGPAPPSTTVGAAATRPVSQATISPTSPRLVPADAKTILHRRSDDHPDGLNSSGDKSVSPKSCTQTPPAATVAALRNKSKKSGQAAALPSAHSAGSAPVAMLLAGDEILTGEPGSIAAAQREQAMLRKAQRKMRTAHYGRAPGKVAAIPTNYSSSPASTASAEEERRCSFITSNSDPIYVAYHDQEWGVPAHDDKMLFELLVLAGAQVGFDWTTILKKRDGFRAAFAGFDAEEVAKFNERQMAAVSAGYRIDMGRVRSVVDNANRILEVKEEFGSLDEYVWGFVNRQPMSTRYSSSGKIPAKSSKSEAISKDMVRRGFRFAGPTVVYSFMQAAGLTNDHLLSCPRRRDLLQQHHHHQHHHCRCCCNV